MKKSLFKTIDGSLVYPVPVKTQSISGLVEVPGSKSITNRALLLAALATGKSLLKGTLFSDDSRHFLDALIALGFEVSIDEPNKEVRILGLGGFIPNQTATINVGSAGTAARFLTAMLGLSQGIYTINCSDQMKKRPMKPLFDALVSMGASISYLEAEGYLPVEITGNKGKCHAVTMDITKSTQFLSALLLVAPMSKNGMNIEITSPKKEGSYITVTRHLLTQFGVTSTFKDSYYHVPAHSNYSSKTYMIEPDMSAACYFYAIAALTGGTITVKGVHKTMIQGDIKFIDVLSRLGCQIKDNPEGIQVIGPQNGYPGIQVDMNDFSDQTMTLAVLAVFASSPTTIQNVSHIQLQESDRMKAIVDELTKIGIMCYADGDHIYIQPSQAYGALLDTYDDHRMAMAFSLLGLRIKNIVIKDPLCCKKTFENYFDVLDELISDYQ